MENLSGYEEYRQKVRYCISFPSHPWPWYCSDPAYGAIGYLAFPVNLLTNDLSLAIRLAPLSLLIYVVLGSLLKSLLGVLRPSLPDSHDDAPYP